MIGNTSTPEDRPDLCRILSLDGGGAKGFYTLGVLREVEALLGRRLYEHFPLCQGSCPLLHFSSISQVGGIGR